jgi:uncharacterized protein (TIGR02271 family)
MTMHAEELIGARVTGGDGQVVGTVEQVFNDDADGRPVWALIRAGKKDKFVPLGGSRITKDGLNVPFDSRQIMSSPEVDAGRHMSAEQADELNRHFGLSVPQQGRPGDSGQQDTSGRTGQDTSGRTGQDTSGQAGQQDARGRDVRGQGQPAQDGDGQLAGEWVIRAEERVDVGTEVLETGRARIHKYVDTEPVEQAVHVYHEEVEIERIPITPDEQVRGVTLAEDQQEVILHEERPVFRKEAVPVERVRLLVRRVSEDRTFRDEVRRERIEVESGDGQRVPAAGQQRNR